jgi:DNA-directed RNA polymerase subunit RPC12/RpoP
MADSEPGLITEFQRRRSGVWRRVRMWALGVVPVFMVIPLIGALEGKSPFLFWAIALPTGLLAFYAAFRMVQTINQSYRCPSCEKLVVEKDGIALDPVSCPHCSVRLSERALS